MFFLVFVGSMAESSSSNSSITRPVKPLHARGVLFTFVSFIKRFHSRSSRCAAAAEVDGCVAGGMNVNVCNVA